MGLRNPFRYAGFTFRAPAADGDAGQAFVTDGDGGMEFASLASQSEVDTIGGFLVAHLANESNPHVVTKSQVGLGNVTDDAQIPLSLIDAAGDLLYGSADNTAARLAAGSNGQFLTLSGGLPAWTAAPSAASPLTLMANSSSEIPLTLKGAASQTANLLHCVNSSNGALCSILSDGIIQLGANDVKIRWQNAAHTPSIYGNATTRVLTISSGNNGTSTCVFAGGNLRLGDASDSNDLACQGAGNRARNLTFSGSDANQDQFASGNTILRGGDRTAGTNANGGSLTLRGGAGIGSGVRGQVLITNLPTSDPTVAGAVWNDSGTLKISAG
jgi:hypothetical protein